MTASSAPDANPVVPGRGCDGCTLCCKLLGIAELGKPKGVWCGHCDIGVGCRIYAMRPPSCGEFHCGFLTLGTLKEAWRPSKCKIVVAAEAGGRRLAAYVDPGRPDAWKAEPYYSQLKEWARLAARKRNQVVVCIGPQTIVILPDKDVDLGVVGDDEMIVMQEISSPAGPKLEAHKVKHSDPRAAKLINPT
jgi:hypothetical protein